MKRCYNIFLIIILRKFYALFIYKKIKLIIYIKAFETSPTNIIQCYMLVFL